MLLLLVASESLSAIVSQPRIGDVDRPKDDGIVQRPIDVDGIVQRPGTATVRGAPP